MMMLMQPQEPEHRESEFQQPEQKEGFHLFYLFPLLYVLSIYLYPFFFSLKEEGTAILSCLIYLPILFGVLNIIASIVFCKPQNRIMMLNAAVLMKYAMVPVFIICGLASMASLFLSVIPVPFMIFLGPMVAMSIWIVEWVMLVLEAPYVISYLRLSAKADIRPKTSVIFHTILQFFFVLDVLDIMFLTFRERRWKKLTIFVIVVLAAAVILCLIVLLANIVGVFVS